MHIKVGEQIILRKNILGVDCCELASWCRVMVFIEDEAPVKLDGQEALDLVMVICPSMLEGKRLKWSSHAWVFHNLVAHPALQILSWLGQTPLGFKIHDRTIPRPKG